MTHGKYWVNGVIITVCLTDEEGEVNSNKFSAAQWAEGDTVPMTPEPGLLTRLLDHSFVGTLRCNWCSASPGKSIHSKEQEVHPQAPELLSSRGSAHLLASF